VSQSMLIIVINLIIPPLGLWSVQDLRVLLTENPESFQVSAFIEKLILPLLDPAARLVRDRNKMT
jgi:hypothetical protein